MTLQLKEKAKEFTLKGVDGKMHSLSDYENKPLLAIVFSCNHCPYVVASEREYQELQSAYEDQGFQLITINTNSANADYPSDSYENMVKRAKEKSFTFPYLDDVDQSVSKAYGAGRTPDVFLFNQNRELVYQGRINNNPRNHAEITRHDLKEAIIEQLADKEVSVNQTQAMGCSIKWVS